MYSRRPEPGSLYARAVRLLADPGGRVMVLTIVAYVAAALGLGVAFFGGINHPSSDFATYGIVLLFVSFVSLFYVSLTVINLLEGG